MRITVYITKKFVFAVLFLLIGVCCTLSGIRSLYREFCCIPIEDLTMDNCREGAYVAGTIDSCLTVKVSNISGVDKDMGTSGGFITNLGAAIYDCYTIPTADSHYVRVMLLDDKTDALNAMIAGNAEGVYVEGQIVKEMVERNMPWYERCEQIRDPQKEVLGDYVITQISFEKRRNVLYFGIGMTVVMVLVIWKGKVIAEVYDVEKETEKRVVTSGDFEPWKPQYQGGEDNEVSE